MNYKHRPTGIISSSAPFQHKSDKIHPDYEPTNEPVNNQTSEKHSDWDAFFKIIEDVVTVKIGDSLSEISPTKGQFFIFAFRDRDRDEIVQRWNEAIKLFPVAAILEETIVNSELDNFSDRENYFGMTRAEFALAVARKHSIPLGLNGDRQIFSLLYRENLERSQLQEILGELRDRGLTNINLTVSNDELKAELRKINWV